MYDTKRVMEFSKKCVDGKTGYLDNVLNMFLNIINLFSNLLNIEQ
jgi:FtsH-binding integral membrane protein